jgi:hypothetical protein
MKMLPDLSTIGKWLIVAGLVLALAGAGLWLVGKTGLPLGRLPGDIRIERPGFSFYFPLTSSILVSVVLTVLISLVARLFRR